MQYIVPLGLARICHSSAGTRWTVKDSSRFSPATSEFEDSGISAPGTLGTREDSVISALGTNGTGEDSIVSAPRTHGTAVEDLANSAFSTALGTGEDSGI